MMEGRGGGLLKKKTWHVDLPLFGERSIEDTVAVLTFKLCVRCGDGGRNVPHDDRLWR